MNNMSDTCGLFGKLPMQSDFVSHFLPQNFTDYWHGWLQACLSVSSEQLGNNWRDYFLTAPIWRFAIMPGIVHEQGLIGVLMPSVDEVGRYFPLTIAHLGDHQPWNAYVTATDWFDQAEQTALLALQDELRYSTYMGQVEQLPLPAIAPWPERATHASGMTNTRSTAIDAINHQTAAQELLYLMDDNYKRLLGPYSLWWTDGSDAVAPCLLTCSHLPDSGQYAAMLDGNWQQWHWATTSVAPRP